MEESPNPWNRIQSSADEETTPTETTGPTEAGPPAGDSAAREAGEREESKHCQWCSTAAPLEATRCPSCGASLAERESLGGMVIPGVTDIDPGLKAADADDTFARMARNTARGGRFVLPMGGAFMPGGIVGEAIVMGAALYGATRTPETHVDAMPVGDASSAAVQMAAKLDAEPGGAAQPPAASAGAGPASGAAAATDAGAPSPVQDPWSDLPPVAVQDEIAPRDLASEVAAPFNAGGPAPVQDPWGDLPPVPAEEQIAGTELDPWAVRDQSAAAARYDPWATPSAPPNPDAAASPTPDPWATGSGPWSGDPWAAGPGPWSQDLWGSTAGQSGDDTSEPRKPR